MSKEEPKVTECWTQVDLDEHYPCAGAVSEKYQCPGDRPAILMWREDYDAMRVQLKKLELELQYATDDNNRVSGELERLKVELDNANAEWSGWKKEAELRGEEIAELRKELEELRAETAKWKPFEHGHCKQEGAMASFVCNYSTEAHDNEE